MVARLPGGVPAEFRRKVLFNRNFDLLLDHVIVGLYSRSHIFLQLWLTLAEQHFLRIGVDWTTIESTCFSDTSNADDEELDAQIARV